MTVLGIFAHPDDESFFTGGTLAVFAKENNNVYTICVTNGEKGENSSNKKGGLAEIRRGELLESAQILGVKKVYFLNYDDGSLSNNLYHEIAEKIKSIVDELKPEILLTFEPRGISGHIDHMAVSMITSFVFEKSDYMRELWYFCHSDKIRETLDSYYIYWPPGYSDSEISKTVDIESVFETKVKSMVAHNSQMHDVMRILKNFESLPKEEKFIILKK